MARGAGGRRVQVSCKSEKPPGPPPTPRHLPRPAVKTQSPLQFQLSASVFALICLAAQYVNLYHTVWWLPFSQQHYAVNYQLICRPTAIFISAILCRRLPCALVPGLRPRDSALLFLFPILGYATFQICRSYGLLSLAFLLYPSLIYCVVFGFTWPPFVSPTGCSDDPPDHLSCLAAKPVDIRQEAANFRTDFNTRLKLVLFDSLLVYYYASFEPCVLMSFHLHVDFCALFAHGWATWLGALSLYANYYFDPVYIDSVHRCALHLGRWQRVEPRHAPHHLWSDHCFWPQNNLVKVRTKEYFRAEAICNAAEPGNVSHLRLYALFSQPQQLTRVLMMLIMLQVSSQLWMLVTARYWQNSIVAILLLLAGSSSLFRTVRQHLITKKLYSAERDLQENSQSK
ncbi:transmembrane protein 39A-A-like [Tropilaelaps mercedesae]|uniref:Transmembrane protein 39A-A-like n=1 Tax=Tropilaelaps mercedesae TaxID=418985 RepID=A0A1V9X871_9ACAR|nr:transmembrane protein 39A-A-like [Tropilaelaps mercedesae]